MTKTVYLVRHGQSVDNAQPVFQAGDSPLSDKGKLQAQAVADRLKTIEFDALLTSPVPRARQTADIIGQATGKTPIESELFIERLIPIEIQGKPWSDQTATNYWKAWDATLYESGKQVGDTDNYDLILERVDRVLRHLLDRPESTIVVVTHGYFLRSIVARVLFGDQLTGSLMWRFQHLASIDNTALTILEYRDAFEEDFAWRLKRLNDSSHL